MIVGRFIFVCIVCIVAVPDIRGQDSKELILKEAESRLRAVYERGRVPRHEISCKLAL